MILDAGTFIMSLSLDALLCCAISAALTRALPSSSEALWSWSGAMLCAAVSFSLVGILRSNVGGNPVLSLFLPHAFALAGAMSLYSACLILNGRRVGRTSSALAVAGIFALAIGLNWPEREAARSAFTLCFCAGYGLMGAYAFASEARWRKGFGGWLAILSLLAMAICAASLGMAKLAFGMRLDGLAPFLFFFEAAFLSSSFAFILGAGELARAQALDLSMRDGLTGLLTKRAFLEMAAPAIASARRASEPCVAMMIDIDFFKRINDTHGHLAGDCAISHASALILRSLRSSDICARFGGEEFCALLPNTSAEGALQVAERILESARREPARYFDPRAGLFIDMPYTVSVGIHWQMMERPEDDAAALLARADGALYSSKRSGRDRATLSPQSIL